jgi:hypothetical protein
MHRLSPSFGHLKDHVNYYNNERKQWNLKKDGPGAIPGPSDRHIELEALFIKPSVKQGSVQTDR